MPCLLAWELGPARVQLALLKPVLACRASSKLHTAPHFQISVCHIQLWITPGRLHKAWEAKVPRPLHVIVCKHFTFQQSITVSVPFCLMLKQTCVPPTLTDRLLPANKRKSLGNATSNPDTTISEIFIEIPFFSWLYNTRNLLCTVQPSNILAACVPASPPPQWACQSPVLPARIWHAVKRDLEIRAAVQLDLLITDLYEIAWQNVNNDSWHPTCYHMPEMFGGWNRMTWKEIMCSILFFPC